MKKLIAVFALFISVHSFAQQLTTDNPLVNDAFKLAVQTVDINVRRGVLAAGADYGGEWTRDIAINSWNGASLLRPNIAEQSLWSVTKNRDTIGHQYWDKIIWAIAAYNHYLITGDKIFLKQAYACSAKTMQQLEGQTYDAKYGLFRGPSVFNDGIAAYPEPVYDPTNPSGASTDHPGTRYIKCLSTNCIYYGAYVALNKMAKLLGVDDAQSKTYTQKAADLKQNILKYLYNADNNSFNYLIDQNGGTAKYQEGLGISFAVMFGVIDGDKANQLISNANISKYGLTTIYPAFPRHGEEKPGRHNNLIWPMVNGFFAQAAIDSKSYPVFTEEFYNLTHLALDEDKGNYDFREIYSPYNGQPEGGWQSNGPTQLQYHWASCKLQTWSATAYISMVLHGLVGARFSANVLSFAPYLPVGITNLKYNGFMYRGRDLDIIIEGNGNHIKRFVVDGKVAANHIGESLPKGHHDVVIVVGD
jgi:hypothetical protein